MAGTQKRVSRSRARGSGKVVKAKATRAAAQTSYVSYYSKLLSRGPDEDVALESLPTRTAAARTSTDFSKRADSVHAELSRVVRDYLDDDQELRDLVDRIAEDSRRALKALDARDERKLASSPATRAALEVIVETDGSRPTFMVRNGKVDLRTSPVGSWEGALNASAPLLQHGIACVGRIDLRTAPQGFAGTGFLIQEDLVLTNRHVLQGIAAQKSNGTWQLESEAAIDFGHEFRARGSVARRALHSVVFAGPTKITGVNHRNLDLALIRTEKPAPADKLDYYLAVNSAPDWATRDKRVYVVGYPGEPLPGSEKATLLEKLFKSTFGCKRCAPGLIKRERQELPKSPKLWSVAHDATTLGGNSGSATLIIGGEDIVAALHYGGHRAEPRENWAHVLGATLDATDGRSETTLRQHLLELGVKLIDPFDLDS